MEGAALLNGSAEWVADLLVALQKAGIDELFPY